MKVSVGWWAYATFMIFGIPAASFIIAFRERLWAKVTSWGRRSQFPPSYFSVKLIPMPDAASRKISTLSRLVYLSVAGLAFLFLIVLFYLVFLLFSASKKPPAGILHLTPLEQGSSSD